MRLSTKLIGMCVALGLAACGDDPVQTPDADSGTDVPLFDGSDGFPEVDVEVNGDATFPDTRDTTDTNIPDSNPPDLVPDLEPPTVVSTIPAAGAFDVQLPLDITIVFSEPLFATTIAPQSIKLFDWLGQEVLGTPTLQADGKTVKWRPTQNNQQLVSAYTIRVMANIIADQSGNKLGNTLNFTFTTANYPNQDGYRELAAKYAPNVYSAVDANDSPQLQVPTKFDGDGDWNLMNNRTWAVSGAESMIPAVYFTVSETYTHYYLTYGYYFPMVNHNIPEYVTGNAMPGVLVVVEKARGETAERPVLAFSFWKEASGGGGGTGEEQFAFATDESGIVSNGSASDWGLKAVMPQETLFPGGHFETYMSAKTHRSCNWNWSEGGAFARCPLPAVVKSGDVLVFKYIGGSPTEFKRIENVWPTTMSEVPGQPEALGYALIPLYSSLWPRRTLNEPDGVFTTTQFTYLGSPDRPGANLKLSGAFQQSVAGADLSAFGEPVWAYGWDPSAGSSGNDFQSQIKKGQIALDPAFYVWVRHHRSNNANGLTTYDSTTGAGFALDYCFNGFVALDARTTDPKCTATP